MSDTFFASEERTARKKYFDDTFEWIDSYMYHRNYQEDALAFSEKRMLVKWRTDTEWAKRILPGQKHIYQASIQEGQFCSFRGKIELNEFCNKYKLYCYD